MSAIIMITITMFICAHGNNKRLHEYEKNKLVIQMTLTSSSFYADILLTQQGMALYSLALSNIYL